MPMRPARFAPYEQLDAEIQSAIRKLGPEVVHVAYRFREDSTGEPSIFFKVVLTDAATEKDVIAEVTRRVTQTLMAEVRPIENWGLFPYFNYRSYSEQQQRPDPDWS